MREGRVGEAGEIYIATFHYGVGFGDEAFLKSVPVEEGLVFCVGDGEALGILCGYDI